MTTSFVSARRVRNRPSLLLFGGIAFGIAVFHPYLISQIAPLRLVQAVICLSLILLVVSRPTASNNPATAPTFALGTIFCMSIPFGQIVGDDEVAMNIQRTVVLLPGFLIIGYFLEKNKIASIKFWHGFVMIGATAALLIIAEWIVGSSLLARDLVFDRMQRDDWVRAVGAGEHPLVVGTLLAATIPLVMSYRLLIRIPMATLFLLGSAATGSRAPMVIGFLLFVVVLSPRNSRRLLQRARYLPLLTVSLVLAVIGVLTLTTWSPVAAGVTGAEYSLHYRAAIYAHLPDILAGHPLGHGFGALPVDEYQIESALFGTRDLVQTVDSEMVYTAMGFGIVGIACYMAAILLPALAARLNPPVSLAALALSIAGLILALRAWDSISPIWYVCLGSVAATWVTRFEPKSPEAPSH